MKRLILAFALSTIAGSSWGASRMPILGGTSFPAAYTTFFAGSKNFPGGVDQGTQSFLNGEITRGFDYNRNGFSGFAVTLTKGTRYAFLGTTAAKSFDTFYDTLLPTYEAADGPAMKLAEPAKPLTGPLAKAFVRFTDLTVRVVNGPGKGQGFFAFGSSVGRSMGMGRLPLPGLEG